MNLNVLLFISLLMIIATCSSNAQGEKLMQVNKKIDLTDEVNPKQDHGKITRKGHSKRSNERATDETTIDESATDEPTTDESATDEPTTDESATDESATDERSTDERSTDEPDTAAKQTQYDEVSKEKNSRYIETEGISEMDNNKSETNNDFMKRAWKLHKIKIAEDRAKKEEAIEDASKKSEKEPEVKDESNEEAEDYSGNARLNKQYGNLKSEAKFDDFMSSVHQDMTDKNTKDANPKPRSLKPQVKADELSVGPRDDLMANEADKLPLTAFDDSTEEPTEEYESYSTPEYPIDRMVPSDDYPTDSSDTILAQEADFEKEYLTHGTEEDPSIDQDLMEETEHLPTEIMDEELYPASGDDLDDEELPTYDSSHILVKRSSEDDNLSDKLENDRSFDKNAMPNPGLKDDPDTFDYAYDDKQDNDKN